LEPDQNPKDLLKLLNAYPADAMKAYEISSKVNKPTNNYPEILDPV
jgi:putative SOS response-associated peptidase YedK